MSARPQLTKAYSAKQVKKKPKKLSGASGQVEIREDAREGGDALLSPLDGEARAKERLLLLFDQKVAGNDAAEELYVQLKAKDALIEQLNARIVTVLAQTQRLEYESLSAKEKQIKTLLEEKSALAKRLKLAEEKSADLEIRARAAEDALLDEREQLGILNEALVEETELLKTQVKDRGEQLRVVKSDIVAISSIVQDLTRVNAELNEKVVALNSEMEKYSAEHYKAMQKAEQVEQVEAELVQTKSEMQRLESKWQKLTKETEELQEIREIVNKVGKAMDEAIVTLSGIEREDCGNVARELDTWVTEMRKVGIAPRDLNPEKISSLKSQIRELRLALDEEKRNSAKTQSSEKVHRARVESLTSEHERMKTIMQDTIDRFRKRISPLQEAVDKGVVQRQELEAKAEVNNADVQMKQTQLTHLSEKTQRLKARLEELRKSEEESRKIAKEMKVELVTAQSAVAEFQEKENERDTKTKDALSRLTATTEELWRRDNEILRRETQRLKLVEELTALKSSVQHSQMRLKYRAAEEIGQFNSQLEEKEKEILVLKKMLQGKNNSGSAETPPTIGKRDHLSLLDIADKLDQGIRRLKVLKALSDGDNSENARKKAIGVIRTLQNELKQYRSTVLPNETVQSLPRLQELTESSEEEVTVGGVIDMAVGLIS